MEQMSFQPKFVTLNRRPEGKRWYLEWSRCDESFIIFCASLSTDFHYINWKESEAESALLAKFLYTYGFKFLSVSLYTVPRTIYSKIEI